MWRARLPRTQGGRYARPLKRLRRLSLPCGGRTAFGRAPGSLRSPEPRARGDGLDRVALAALEERAPGRNRRRVGAGLERELDREGRALADLALRLDRAAVLLDDPVREREAETRAAPCFLRREEGLEEALEVLGLDPGPVVLD